MFNFFKYPKYLDKRLIKKFDNMSTQYIKDHNKIYYENHRFYPSTRDGNFIYTVEPIDTINAILKYSNEEEKVTALNFASFCQPGGGCLLGIKAQEESLCYKSNLFFHLNSKFLKNYYRNNRRKINKGFYKNRAIYTRDVKFAVKDKRNKNRFINKTCDIITCAAPRIRKFYGVSNMIRSTRAMDDRIKFILDVAEENNVDTLILGAWGCGVYRQDPVNVASAFYKHLSSGNYHFKKVIFAVYNNGKDSNYKIFKEILG